MEKIMSDGFKGQCLCGAISYEVSSEPTMMTKCHCRDCQYISGGEASPIVFLPEDAITVSGAAKTYSVAGNSGGQVHRSFCGSCGTHIYSKADVAAGMVFVKAGTMDKAAAAKLKTAMVFYAANANMFSHIDEDAKVFDKNPE